MTSTHRFHEIGRTECVAEGCEPVVSTGTTLPPYDAPVREAARRMGNSNRAWAAARRMAR